MINLRDWNSVLKYAKEVTEANSLEYRVYTMYDGRAGIRILQKDIDGNLFGKAWSTGIHDTKEAYISAIDGYIKTFLVQC